MSDEFLGDRRKALEDSFFDKQDKALMQKLRQQRESEARRDALAAASGIRDAAVLDKLVASDISPETLAALALVPLVAVAWADGTVEPKERDAVLAGAEQTGIEKRDVGHALLEGWLAERPGDELLEAWREYVRGLHGTLDAVALAALKRDVLARARAVAEAAGGFLGLGRKVSSEEEAVLEDLERAFG